MIEQARLARIEQAPETGPNAMVRLLASIVGVGVETADMLVQEVLSRNLRDRRAVARYAGLTGSPDESGSKRREKGLAKSGNARVRRGLIQLAWRFLLFQKDSALAQWYRARTGGANGARKTTMVVALARKLLIAMWRMVTTGEIPEGVRLREEFRTPVGVRKSPKNEPAGPVGRYGVLRIGPSCWERPCRFCEPRARGWQGFRRATGRQNPDAWQAQHATATWVGTLIVAATDVDTWSLDGRSRKATTGNESGPRRVTASPSRLMWEERAVHAAASSARRSR
jgi:hypothetical protein